MSSVGSLNQIFIVRRGLDRLLIYRRARGAGRGVARGGGAARARGVRRRGARRMRARAPGAACARRRARAGAAGLLRAREPRSLKHTPLAAPRLPFHADGELEPVRFSHREYREMLLSTLKTPLTGTGVGRGCPSCVLLQ